MENKCSTCKHWDGNKYSQWADCQQVIFTMDAMNHQDRFGNKCEAPFDPHDIRYYLSSSDIFESLKYICHMMDSNQINMRVDVVEEYVLTMDDQGTETVKKVLMPYFQTDKHFECERYEKK